MPPLFSRRNLLVAAGLTAAIPGFSEEPNRGAEAAPKDAEEALARLKEGNARFAKGQTRHAHESADWRKHLVGGQKPFATILGCSDSRVPIELVFDQGFGDLFVIRVAGNVIAPDVIGSLVYALAHLQTKLFVVLGHEGCGAVTAALQALSAPSQELPGIQALVKMIEPGLPPSILREPAAKQLSAAVEANVRWSIQQLSQLKGAKSVLDSKQVLLLGAVYELETGKVRFL